MAKWIVVCGVALAWLMMPATGLAQETREATIAQQQAEKAKNLAEYKPNRAEEWINRIEDNFLVPSGFYPYFGSVYSGGGFTLGAGYRQAFADRSTWNVNGLWSLKNYKLIQADVSFPGKRRTSPSFTLRTGWRDATQVAYHGLGIDSPETATKTNFRMKQGWLAGDAEIRPVSFAVFRGGLAYEAFTLSEGTGTTPSIEQIFTPATAPGLGDNPNFLHAMVSAGLDTRPSPGYARHGGLAEVSYHLYNDVDDKYTFDRVDAEAVYHQPILRENWVVSVHGLVQTTLDGTDVVPFFLLPSLGSGSTLRAYPSWRFRDRHSALFQAEWRWIPSRLAMDAAIFYDAGVVAPKRDLLAINKMRDDFGFGVRFHGPLSTPLRIEIANGAEGINLVFAGSAAF
jgi:hypothetical protein